MDVLDYNVAVQAKKPFIMENALSAGNCFLDAGCGTGYFLDQLQSHKKKIAGIDLDGSCIRYLHKRKIGNKKNIIQASITSIPFFDHTFDVVICSEVLEHIDEPLLALKEMKRVLKKNGILILTTPSLDGIFRITKTCHEHGLEEHHVDGFTMDELESKLNSINMVVEKKSYCMVFFANIWMELTKQVYRQKNKQFDSQTQLTSVNDSFLFRVWKTLFFIPAFFIYIDEILSYRFKGSMNLIVARVKE